jgi:transcriptional regulator with XRE-family HTH domain
MARLAPALKGFRERAGLSQIQVSHAAGLSETYYGKIESGGRRPSGPVLMRLLDVFGCSTEERHRAVQLLAGELLPGVLLQYLDGTPPARPREGPGEVAAGPPLIHRRRWTTAPAATRTAAQRRHWTRTVRPFVLALVTGGGGWLGNPLAIAHPRPITDAGPGRGILSPRRKWAPPQVWRHAA